MSTKIITREEIELRNVELEQVRKSLISKYNILTKRKYLKERLQASKNLLIPARTQKKLIGKPLKLDVFPIEQSRTDGKRVVIGLSETFGDMTLANIYSVYEALLAHEVQHVLSSDFKIFNDFIKDVSSIIEKELEKLGVPKKALRRMKPAFNTVGKSIMNIIEDGRIENMIAIKYAGYVDKLRLLNLLIRDNLKLNEIHEGQLEAERDLSIFFNSLLSFSKLGIPPKKFKSVKDTRGYKMINKVTKEDLVEIGVASRNASDCDKICRKIFEIVQDDIVSIYYEIYEEYKDDFEQMDKIEEMMKDIISSDIKDTRESETLDDIDEDEDLDSKKSSVHIEHDEENEEDDEDNKEKSEDCEDIKDDVKEEDSKEEDSEEGSGSSNEDEEDSEEGSDSSSKEDGDDGKDNDNEEDDDSSSAEEALEDAIDKMKKDLSDKSEDEMKNGLDSFSEKMKNSELTDEDRDELRAIHGVIPKEFDEKDRYHSLNKDRESHNYFNSGREATIFKRSIQSIMRNKQSVSLRGQKSGILDTSSLWKISSSNYNVFKREGSKDLSDYAIYVLYDNSGSMGEGNKRYDASRALSIIEEGLKDISSLKITTFKSGIAIDIFSGDEYEFIDHELIRGWNDNKSNINYTCSFHKYMMSGCYGYSRSDGHSDDHEFLYRSSIQNRDGMSIEIATKELLSRPEKDKILIVLSDGEPACVGLSLTGALEETVDAVQRAKRQGITVMGLGFEVSKRGAEDRLPVYREIYGNNVLISDSENMHSVLSKMVKKIIKSR